MSSKTTSRQRKTVQLYADDDDHHHVRRHTATGQSRPPSGFFIPGITARARCLSSEGVGGEVPTNHHSPLPMDDYSSGSSSNEAPLSFRRRRMLAKMGSERSDSRFHKMMEELRADREAADAVRKEAIEIKARFEQGDHSDHSRNMIMEEIKKYGSGAA